MQLFSPFGPIESLRLLIDKECAFINFSNLEDAVRAKDEVLGRLNGRVGHCVVRVGFGKVDGGVSDPSVLQPTRALCKLTCISAQYRLSQDSMSHLCCFLLCRDWKLAAQHNVV